MFKLKKIFCFLFTILIMFSSYSQAFFIDSSSKKVLVIGSYNFENLWERSIIEAFIKSSNSDFKFHVEFIDSKIYNSNENYQEFLNLLNAKYKDEPIDYILTIDDEALSFVRQNLFNNDCILYKTKTVFVGLNSFFSRTPEEENYITGILDYQNNYDLVNLIRNTNKNLKSIYLISDNSIYCETIKKNITDIVQSNGLPIDIIAISGKTFKEIEPNLENINSDNSVILINGTYFSDDDKTTLSSDDTINFIKAKTKAPIFTKLDNYVKSGAIGGIINDGTKLGEMAYSYMTYIDNSKNQNLLAPAYNTLNIPKFNFKAIREYNINPVLLPRNSQFINKNRFDLLVSKKVEIFIWSTTILFFISLSIFSYFFILNKYEVRKNKALLNESIQSNNIKTDFIITISHELRTPLNIIINSCKLLYLKINDNNFDKEFFETQLSYIDKNSSRLLKLVNNIIDVSKIEIGYMDVDFSMGNIVEIVEESALSIVDLAKQYNIDIIFDTNEEIIITAFDKSKIERVILNLISNAIKSMETSGVININMFKKENCVIIEVKDTGKGIPEDMLPYIFEKFKKAHSYTTLAGRQEGSGLGLFIVKGIVELHQGTITVESKLQLGTKFKITLPLIQIDDENKTDFMKSNLDYLKKIELSDLP